MTNSKFKHIFSDFDGTLTESKNNKPCFDENLIKKINELKKHNVGFSIATGRHYKDILLQLEKNNIKKIDYIIGMAGAQIYDVNSQKEVFLRIFNEEEIKEFHHIYSYLKTNYFNQFNLFVYLKNDSENDAINLIDSGAKVFDSYIEKYLFRMKSNIEYLNFVISNNIDWCKEIYKIAIYVYDFVDGKFSLSQKLFQKILHELKSNFKRFDFIECGKCYFEICLKEINKGNGIKYINDNFLKLDLNEIICFGDSDNDISMFQLLKNSVTRKTASENFKKKSKFVLNYPASVFVLKGIEKLVLT